MPKRLPLRLLAVRRHIRRWVDDERAGHADSDVKYKEGSAGRDLLKRAALEEGYGNTWDTFIQNYLSRARVFGVHTPEGRQALGKALVTLTHCCETVAQTYGPFPQPGTPSGEVQSWPAYPLGEFPFEMNVGQKIDKRQPEILVTEDGIVGVEDGRIARASQPEEGDDGFALQA